MNPSHINNRGYILTSGQRANLDRLCLAVSELERLMGVEFVVTSGLRSEQDQMRINPAAKFSAHLTGEAVDVADKDGKIYDFCVDNIEEIIRIGLYLENRLYTPNWAHLTVRKPKSGNRFFIP